jgi:hypothetical protein
MIDINLERKFKMDKIELVNILVDKFTLPPERFETFRDSIQLEWENDKGYLELEIFNNKINVLVMDKDDNVIFEF